MSSVAKMIETKLKASLSPSHLEVINESHMHNVVCGGWLLSGVEPMMDFVLNIQHCRPKNSETHFKVLVVSNDFDSKPLLARHRSVNAILADELAGPVHALSIVAKTPSQWKAMQESGEIIPPSPNCQGGDGSLPKRT